METVPIPKASSSTGIILSENPIRYSAILNAVAKNIVNPIAPPMGRPKLLVNI